MKMSVLKWMAIMMFAIVSFGFLSCSKDDETDTVIPTNLYGTWSGSATIVKTGTVRNLTVTFKTDKSGTFTFSSRVYYRAASFTYSMSNRTITCNGIIVGEDGVINDFNQQFQYNETNIKPIGSYTDITLTK